jgi:hypothetical protein
MILFSRFASTKSKSEFMKFKCFTYVVLLCAVLLPLTINCTKEADKTLPSIIIATITGITATTATCGGSITSEGSSKVVLRGVHWTSKDSIPPDLYENTTNDSIISGSFVSLITGLEPSTTYRVWAFAYNEAGVIFSEEKIFITSVE